MKNSSVIETLLAATADDLADLESRIAEKKAARDSAIEDWNKQIDSMESLAKTIRIRIEGNPRRKPKANRKPQKSPPEKQEPPASDVGLSNRKRIELFLRKHGPAHISLICERLDLTTGSVSGTLSSNQQTFTRVGPGEYDLKERG